MTGRWTNSKLDKQDLLRAISVMGSVIAWFPDENALAIQVLMAEFESMIETREQLNWLAHAAIRTFREWGKDCTLPSLRALYCTRYDPLDGVQPAMELADFDKLEAAYRTREILENTRKIEQWKREVALNPGAYAPFLIEGKVLKPLPEIKEAWRCDNKPDYKLQKQELKQIEDQVTATAGEAAMHRRTDEESARAVEDLRIQLELRGHNPPPDPTQKD